ncbi:PqiC family protein [Parendozoicomonas sp. Alg238-R29]|uniref:PqiC family protein n=1 Tax=Parendozoicomonas sp. Alg238-R29 TaxID=2993446 RepID=UPI00248DD2D2|nr:PqiC family protein [Parendozoicomonas sp. Alg238-R29]
MNRIFYCLVLLTALAGCASTQTFDYYRLKPDAVAGNYKVVQNVGVAPVIIPGWMTSNLMSWSDGYKIHRTDNDRWSFDVKSQIEHVLSTNLSRELSGKPVNVGPWLGGNRPDRAVFVEITDVSLTGANVEMAVNWRIENKERETIYRQNEEPFVVLVMHDGTREEAFVQGLSSALVQLSEQIAGKLAAYQ